MMYEIIDKIYNLEKLKDDIKYWKNNNNKIIFTNGCFDILHRGHIEYLIKAREMGDILIIGLNSNDSIKKLKGENRPINDEKSRSLILASLMFVDVVIVFDEDTPLNLIKMINPDILVKGGDYIVENIVGYDIVKNNGGDVITIPLVGEYSTTNIINNMNN